MSKQELLSKGITTCAGCPMELTARVMLEVLGSKVVTTTPPSCAAIITGFEERTAWGVPAQQTVLMSIAAYTSGLTEALQIRGIHDAHVVAFAGDGGTFDIGLQALSGAIERGHNILFICYDNEAYMNTGNQRSSATMMGAWTKTTPTGKKEHSKNIDFMLLHQNLAYQATASVGNIKDLKRKIKRASQIKGPKMLHIHNPCPTGWKFQPEKTIKVAKLAIDSGLWLLWERDENGIKINKVPKDYSLTANYMQIQKRFARISEDQVNEIIKEAKKKYTLLKKMEEIQCL